MSCSLLASTKVIQFLATGACSHVDPTNVNVAAEERKTRKGKCPNEIEHPNCLGNT